MVQAYILVQTEVGKAADVARQIAQIAGVTQAEDVTGPYDVIVRASAENVDELGKLVHELLRRAVDTLEPEPGYAKASDVQPPHLRYQLKANTIATTQPVKSVTASVTSSTLLPAGSRK